MAVAKRPRVMFGALTARQHAIVEARKWQLEHIEQPGTPAMLAAHLVIADLLAQFGTS